MERDRAMTMSREDGRPSGRSTHGQVPFTPTTLRSNRPSGFASA